MVGMTRSSPHWYGSKSDIDSGHSLYFMTPHSSYCRRVSLCQRACSTKSWQMLITWVSEPSPLSRVYLRGRRAARSVRDRALCAPRPPAKRSPRLLRVTPEAVKVADCGVHHWILAPGPEAVDQVLKLHLVLEVVARNTARLLVVVLAKLEVARL